MGGPEGSSLGFSATEEIIWKAHKGPIGASDLLPLAKFMQAGDIFRQFELMMAKLIWRAPRDRTETEMGSAPATGGSFQHPTQDDDDFVELKTTNEVAAAIANSKDRMRLYSTQGYSLMYLLLRLIWVHLAWVIFACLVRTCTIILQAWVLWTIVRIATGDPVYNYGDPLCYIITALLPIGTWAQSLVQHNSFQIGTRAALMCRTATIALIFEKVR
eukprot:PhF_6_TR16725/c1_g1_i1/m.25351